jgi:hypothetical protein
VTQKKFSLRLALCVIALPFVELIVILVCGVLHYFDGDQLMNILEIVVPMFSCYGIAAVRFLFSDHVELEIDNLRSVSVERAVVAFSIPIIFFSFISALIVVQATGRSALNFEQFKRYLFAGETIFSGFMGEVIYRMLGPVDARPDPQTQSEEQRSKLSAH